MDDIAIKVQHVGKTFKLPHDRATSVKSNLINVLKRRHGYELQHALHDIDFGVKAGEFFGIVGKNGGGKSTLLKVISGIYSPSKGHVHINGKLTPFIELGVGFNPELSGRENVYLNGALLGFNRKEMDVMYDDIVAFAELGRFMDQKLKNYSSGMQVRLAFSIAIRAKSDILVMDEVLAVGDAAFQKKCFEVFRELKRQKRTIILVTHDMANVEKFCDRVLIIDKGKQLTITTPQEASSIYARLNVSAAETHEDADQKVRLGSGEITVKEIGYASKQDAVFELGKPLAINIELERSKGYESYSPQIGLAIYNEDDTVVCGPNNIGAKLSADASRLRFTMPEVFLAPGGYRVTLAVYDKEGINRFDYLEKWLRFTVIADHGVAGLVEVSGTKWEEV